MAMSPENKKILIKTLIGIGTVLLTALSAYFGIG